MNTFRFVLYSWCCTILLYPPLVLFCDLLSTNNTELHLIWPLLAGAIVLGLPGLFFGWLTLYLLRDRHLSPAAQYTAWTISVLFIIWATLSILGCTPLHPEGEEGRFILPLFGAALVVLLLRYPYYMEIPETEF